MNDAPIYISKRTGKACGRSIAFTRTGSNCNPGFFSTRSSFRRRTIFKNRSAPAIFRGQKGFIWGVKLDNCNFCRHVLLIKKSGLFKRIGFSPDDPEKFIAVCQSILTGTA